ncbi:NUT family member 2F [Sciurus carolinensis]|uniref:NUT family member 2F n=1 Tax=Sciurus carolinensis TaxID=30640 RepID=A0AA41SNI0_SCICA|nr:NUT family member 2F [Sciurus carolinensis]
MFPMNAQQWLGRVYGEGALPTLQAAVPPDDSNKPQSIYENFRRWQRFKTLVRRHLPQNPDVEALSCFLIKTSLKARPARSSAAKSKVPQTQTKVSETKARETKAHALKAPKTKAPEEIPPDVVQEYLNNMDQLVGPTNFTTWEPSSLFTGELAANLGEEELEQQPIDDDLYPDPNLLSYVDEDFIKKVEDMIHPRFLEELLSSKQDINILALTKELEQEEGLTSGQVDRGRRVSQQTRVWR